MTDGEGVALIPDAAVATGMPIAAEVTVAPGMTEFAAYDGGDKFEVIGNDMQVLHVKLAPGEQIICEPGSMSYMQSTVSAGIDCNSCFPRCMSGNWCIMSAYSNSSAGDSTIALTPNIPAKVIPLKLSGESGYVCKRGSYMAQMGSVQLGYDFDCCSKTCCCAGQGCVRQTLFSSVGSGGEGTAFLAAMGTIMTKQLEEGEVSIVDTNSVVAWTHGMELGVKLTSSNPCVACCGGEGLFNTTLTGPGEVYFQSTSIEKVKAALKIAAIQMAAKGQLAGGPPEATEMAR